MEPIKGTTILPGPVGPDTSPKQTTGPGKGERTGATGRQVTDRGPASVVSGNNVPESPVSAPAAGATNASPLNDTVEQILDAVAGQNTRLRIDRDADTGKFIYLVVDVKSGEVRKQFPPEQVIRQIAAYRNVEGLVVDNSV